MKFFQMPEYRLARELFKLAMSGMPGYNLYNRADRLVEEWGRLQGKEPPGDYKEEKSDDERYDSDSGDDEPYYSDQNDG